MTTGQPPPPPPPPDDPAAVLRDWMTLALSELAGLAGDREALETWQGLIGLWAQAARAATAPHDPAVAAPWPAPAAAAPAVEQPRLAALLGRIDALERRIAALERPVAEPAVGRRAGRPRGRKPAG